MACALDGCLNTTMPAPIGTYICLCASIVTESASSIAIGDGATITGIVDGKPQSAFSIAIGQLANVNEAEDAIALGKESQARGNDTVAIGNGAIAEGDASVSIGKGNRATGKGFVRYVTMVDEFAPVGHCLDQCP